MIGILQIWPLSPVRTHCIPEKAYRSSQHTVCQPPCGPRQQELSHNQRHLVSLGMPTKSRWSWDQYCMVLTVICTTYCLSLEEAVHDTNAWYYGRYHPPPPLGNLGANVVARTCVRENGNWDGIIVQFFDDVLRSEQRRSLSTTGGKMIRCLRWSARQTR